MIASTLSLPITKFTSGNGVQQADTLAIEEPLEIRIRFGMALESKNLSVTMRTPGHDEELALGFLLSEGIITAYEQIVGVVREGENQLSVILHEDVSFDPLRFERHVYTTSSCGICGKASIDAIRVQSHPPASLQHWTVTPAILCQLPRLLRTRQADFEITGGLHAAALFSPAAELLLLREDVGRHNAVDKLVGAAMQANLLPLVGQILLLSGRASFELIQKASLAGITLVAAVGAPSSLAVQLAEEAGITLVGFLRDNHFNVYTRPERIQED